MTDRPTILIRSPEDCVVELVVSKDGNCDVTELSLDQLRCLMLQAVHAYVRWEQRGAIKGR